MANGFRRQSSPGGPGALAEPASLDGFRRQIAAQSEPSPKEGFGRQISPAVSEPVARDGFHRQISAPAERAPGDSFRRQISPGTAVVLLEPVSHDGFRRQVSAPDPVETRKLASSSFAARQAPADLSSGSTTASARSHRGCKPKSDEPGGDELATFVLESPVSPLSPLSPKSAAPGQRKRRMSAPASTEAWVSPRESTKLTTQVEPTSPTLSSGRRASEPHMISMKIPQDAQLQTESAPRQLPRPRRFSTGAITKGSAQDGLSVTDVLSTAESGRDTTTIKPGLVVMLDEDSFIRKQYEVVQTMHEDDSGNRVELLCDRGTGKQRIAKYVSTAGMTPIQLRNLRKEIKCLCALDHPHVIKAYMLVEESSRSEIVILFEHCSKDTWKHFQQGRSRTITDHEALIARLVRQLLLAVHYCHMRGVIHGNIQPKSMVFSRPIGSDKKSDGGMDCKLMEFGLFTHIRPRGARRQSGNVTATVLSQASSAAMMSPEGQIMERVGLYASPEVVKKGRATSQTETKTESSCHAFEADVWACGVVALELLTGKNPFFQSGNLEASYHLLQGYRGLNHIETQGGLACDWKLLSSEAKDFCHKVLMARPKERPTAGEAISHPWLAKHRPSLAKLPPKVCQVMIDYASKSTLVRHCVRIITTLSHDSTQDRLPDFGNLCKAFLTMDLDGDGTISESEVAAAFLKALDDEARAGIVMRAADLDRKGELSFSEFLAACLHFRLGTTESIAQQAFEVLDHDRDGLVHPRTVQSFLGALTADLPDRPLRLAEWKLAVLKGDEIKQLPKIGISVHGLRNFNTDVEARFIS
eukprot:gnl/TRDRNA2_/TRDRNA2_42862_c0_seq1.p1 gnl/TRDRNA2_/TRDRNA2_42862_c0~~gnl/TRDRNA2_/TRDRNA2_42862_c0_seq1.p1  ORF type:complete len:813 (+),score=112.08 gnl/TRDRNA2_/TRDRNA2_42862_c0_seq1:89-2527(+)